MGYKTGDKVRFQIYDYQDAEKDENCLLGTPIIGGEHQEDIIVNAPIKNGKLSEYLEQSEFFDAELTHPRAMHGNIVWFVKNLKPVHMLQDYNREYEMEYVETLIKDGCGRCNQPISLSQVKDSLVQPKSHGKPRILCSACLNTAILNAQAEKDKKEKSVNVH